MKTKFILALLVCLTAVSLNSNAQVRLDPFYAYSKYSIGIGSGYTHMYGDLNMSEQELVYKLNVTRHVNEWVNLTFEGSRGGLSSFETKNRWTNGMSSYNKFLSVAVTGNVALGQFCGVPSSFIMKQLFGLYIGAGIGFMNNDITDISTKFKSSDKQEITELFPGSIMTSSNNYYLPMNLGIDLHFTRSLFINVNYQMCYAFTDWVDGYNFKKPSNNNANDLYSTIIVGLHFYTGQLSMSTSK
jgi:hypothetical protein